MSQVRTWIARRSSFSCSNFYLKIHLPIFPLCNLGGQTSCFFFVISRFLQSKWLSAFLPGRSFAIVILDSVVFSFSSISSLFCFLYNIFFTTSDILFFYSMVSTVSSSYLRCDIDLSAIATQKLSVSLSLTIISEWLSINCDKVQKGVLAPRLGSALIAWLLTSRWV